MDIELRETKRQQRKLNFLITQTELYAHFMSRKMGLSAENFKDKILGQRDETLRKLLGDAGLMLDIEDDYDVNAMKNQALKNVQNAYSTQQVKTRKFDNEVAHSLKIEDFRLTDPSVSTDQDRPQPQMNELACKFISSRLEWDSGLGKTVQSIAFLAHIAESQGIWGPFLVIAPASTLHNWQQEFSRFVSKFKVVPYWGNTNDRKILRKFWNQKDLHTDDASFHILVTSYQLVVQDVKYFQRIKWQYMILDEAQAIQTRNLRLVPGDGATIRVTSVPVLLTGRAVSFSYPFLHAMADSDSPKVNFKRFAPQKSGDAEDDRMDDDRVDNDIAENDDNGDDNQNQVFIDKFDQLSANVGNLTTILQTLVQNQGLGVAASGACPAASNAPQVSATQIQASGVTKTTPFDFQKAAGGKIKATATLAPACEESLAGLVNSCLFDVTYEQRIETQSKALIPENLKFLDPPKCEGVFVSKLKPELKIQDKASLKMQSALLRIVVPIIQTMIDVTSPITVTGDATIDETAKAEKQDKILGQLTDALVLVGSTNAAINKRRRDDLQGIIAKKYEPLCKSYTSHPFDLFGPDMDKQLEKLDKLAKLTTKVADRKEDRKDGTASSYNRSSRFMPYNNRNRGNYDNKKSDYRFNSGFNSNNRNNSSRGIKQGPTKQTTLRREITNEIETLTVPLVPVIKEVNKELDTTNNPEDEQRPSRPADYRFLVASPNLVCATAREPDRSSSTLCSKGQIVLGAQARGQAPIKQQNDPAWMQDLRESLQARGFSTHAADLYTASWRKGTVTSYTSGIKR
uniref:Chromatin-remodeling ATPase INO80 n=1 Tax=Strigamia maritima TaxID=126957 RepID=T1IRU0_STRMM